MLLETFLPRPPPPGLDALFSALPSPLPPPPLVNFPAFLSHVSEDSCPRVALRRSFSDRRRSTLRASSSSFRRVVSRLRRTKKQAPPKWRRNQLGNPYRASHARTPTYCTSWDESILAAARDEKKEEVWVGPIPHAPSWSGINLECRTRKAASHSGDGVGGN